MLLLIILSFLFESGFCYYRRINTVDEFISFSDAVTNGKTFSGTTVLLESDIDFSGYSSQFNQIGTWGNRNFKGDFDGQGHVISNLALRSLSTYQATGLFGFADSSTIKNIVVDSSCSFTSSFDDEDYYPFIGGIVGRCDSTNSPCTIENTVNMANISFDGSTSANTYIGGIAGTLFSSNYSNTIKNCANYGSLTYSGTDSFYVEMGGIIGISDGDPGIFVYIQNCLNFGAIIHDGITKYYAIGGIAGASLHTVVNNCVSHTELSLNKQGSFIGGIIGAISAYTQIVCCFWSENFDYEVIGVSFSAYSLGGYSVFNLDYELDKIVNIDNYTGKSLIGALNAAVDHYFLRGYSHWLFNEEGNATSFSLNNNKLNYTLNSQIILLPKYVDEGSTQFYGWYVDSSCTIPITNYMDEGNKSFYGILKENTEKYTITFNSKGGSSVGQIKRQYGTVINLPTPAKRTGYVFLGWQTSYGDPVSNKFTIQAKDITLYATWLPLHITTSIELIDFAEAVNSGTVFTGTTVYLDADIDFRYHSDRFVPIGQAIENYFSGHFDGQGHVISNLELESSTKNVALFGYSVGMTAQNVVIDNSCSFTNSHSDSDAYTGSIVGECLSTTSACTLENIVNMASVTYEGTVSTLGIVGGIIGYSYVYLYSNYIVNCANYGSVAYTGKKSNFVWIGGIVGTSYGNSNEYVYVQNCLNYGNIIHSGTSKSNVIGGISGISSQSYYINCVISGVIPPGTATDYIGIISGLIASDTTITKCYWTDDVGNYETYGENTSTVLVIDSSSVALNQRTLDNLNKDNNWKKWVTFHLNGGVINSLTNETLFGITDVLPIPTKKKNTFLFWCKDAETTTKYEPETDTVTALYAGWNISKLTFDFENGTTLNYTLTFNTPIEYPENMERSGYKFKGWSSKLELMPGKDLVIKPIWKKPSKAGIAIGITIPLVIIIIIVIAIMAFIATNGRDETKKQVQKGIELDTKTSRNDDNEEHKKREKHRKHENSEKHRKHENSKKHRKHEDSEKHESKEDSQDKQSYSRVVAGSNNDNLNAVNIRSMDSLYKLYPSTYVRPTMKKALLKAGLTDKQADDVVEACYNAAQIAQDEGKLFDGFTKDDAAAVAMYTYDFGPDNFESNPYRLINKSLADRDFNKVQSISGILYLVMTALRKLPRYKDKTLYRGVRNGVNLDEMHYSKENTVSWPALSSTSPDTNQIQAFLAEDSKEGIASGTMFIIENGWGYDIQPYSLYPDEAEILLEFERQFKVTSVIKSELNIINITMLDTPLCLPNVFGEGIITPTVGTTNNINARMSYQYGSSSMDEYPISQV